MVVVGGAAYHGVSGRIEAWLGFWILHCQALWSLLFDHSPVKGSFRV